MGKELPFSEEFNHFDLNKEPKFVIWTTNPHAGLGNRIYGLVSTFTLALVTQRVLLIDWPLVNDTFPTDPLDPSKTESAFMIPIEEIIELPFQQWKLSVVLPHLKTKSNLLPFGLFDFSGSFQSDTEERSISYEWNCKEREFPYEYQLLKCHNFDSYPTVIRIQAYEFFADWITMNDNYKSIIKDLFPESNGHFNIFGTLASFLLKPSKSVETRIRKFQEREIEKFDILVSVHIRSMGVNRITESQMNQIFDCTKQRIDLIKSANREISVGVLCAADSNEAKRLTKEIIGDSVIMLSDSSSRSNSEGIIDAFIEMYLLGNTKELITLGHSTFAHSSVGRTTSQIIDSSTCRPTTSPDMNVVSTWCMYMDQFAKCDDDVNPVIRTNSLLYCSLFILLIVLYGSRNRRIELYQHQREE